MMLDKFNSKIKAEITLRSNDLCIMYAAAVIYGQYVYAIICEYVTKRVYYCLKEF